MVSKENMEQKREEHSCAKSARNKRFGYFLFRKEKASAFLNHSMQALRSEKEIKTAVNTVYFSRSM